jgi:hypothetical protein
VLDTTCGDTLKGVSWNAGGELEHLVGAGTAFVRIKEVFVGHIVLGEKYSCAHRRALYSDVCVFEKLASRQKGHQMYLTWTS